MYEGVYYYRLKEVHDNIEMHRSVALGSQCE